MTGRSSSLAVRCVGLAKSFGEVRAVDGLDLEVESGECFGLLGPNGAGKTTTVEILEGLIEPDAGKVEILGRGWSGGGHALRSRLGIQLQEAMFTDKLTVLETATLFRSFHDRGVEPSEAVLKVGLQDKSKSWVRDLSGGQKQRLSLACALVSDPELMFLDEPTTGLDPHSRRQIWAIVEDFRSRGGTVLLTTHYMEEAERLCHRVAVIDHGKIIALGSPRELIATLGAEHVVEFEAEPDLDPAELAGIAGVREALRDGKAVHLSATELHLAVPALLAELARRGVSITRLTTHHATLEDVFLSLTGRHLREGGG